MLTLLVVVSAWSASTSLSGWRAPAGRAAWHVRTCRACAEDDVSARLASAETRVESLFSAIKAAGGSGGSGNDAADAPLVAELRAAQDELADLRRDVQRAECVRQLDSFVGGEAAAEALQALTGAGVLPDGACYRAALGACATGGEPPDGEWALLLLEEAARAGLADTQLSTLAARACAASRELGAALGVWRAAAAARAPPDASALEWLSMRAAAAADADGEVGELTAAIGEHLAAGETLRERYWRDAPGDGARTPLWRVDGDGADASGGSAGAPPIELVLPGAMPAASMAPIVGEVFLRVLRAQREAGPVRSVVDGGVDIVFELPASLFDESRRREGAPEAAEELRWLSDGLCARALQRSAAALASELRSRLQFNGAIELVDAAADEAAAAARLRDAADPSRCRVAVLRIGRLTLEEWVRERAVDGWSSEEEEAERARRAKEAEERAAAEAEASALRAAEEAAAARQAAREAGWAKKNAKLIEKERRERLASRGSLAVAIDAMVDRMAKKAGVAPDADRGGGAGAEDAPDSLSGAERRAEAEARARAMAARLTLTKTRAKPKTPAKTPPAASGDAGVGAVSGVGPAREAALHRAGVETVAQLAALGAEGAAALAKEHGLPLKSLQTSIAAARAMLDESM